MFLPGTEDVAKTTPMHNKTGIQYFRNELARLLAGIASFFCMGTGAGARFSFIAFGSFAVVRGIKPATLKDNTSAFSDKPFEFAVTFGAFS